MRAQIQQVMSRHIWVIAAVVLMVGSAVISYFLVHENDVHIMALRRSQSEMDEGIRSLWDNAGRMDRNVDSAIIISLMSGTGNKQTDAVKQYYFSRIDHAQAMKNDSLLSVLKYADMERQGSVNRINEIYITRAQIENDIEKREQRNGLYATISFFMQLIGLVLVILTREMPHL